MDTWGGEGGFGRVSTQGGRGVSRKSVHVVYEQNYLKNFWKWNKIWWKFYKIKQNLLYLIKKRKFFQKFKVQNPDFLLKSPLSPFFPVYCTNRNVERILFINYVDNLGGGGFGRLSTQGGGVKNSQKSVHVVYEQSLRIIFVLKSTYILKSATVKIGWKYVVGKYTAILIRKVQLPYFHGEKTNFRAKIIFLGC